MVQYRTLVDPGFTRTFMELKHNEAAAQKTLSKSFTRTFMELKPKITLPSLSFISTFYSYLYGIETCQQPTKGSYQHPSFTRTFMELKLEFVVFSKIQFFMGSGLYGIET